MAWLYLVGLLGSGCKPCESLECIEETTRRSILVFEQASETSRIRFQENASLTITSNEQAAGLSTEWFVGSIPEEPDSLLHITICTSYGTL